MTFLLLQVGFVGLTQPLVEADQKLLYAGPVGAQVALPLTGGGRMSMRVSLGPAKTRSATSS